MILSPEQKAIKETLREFALERIRPIARETDETQLFPESLWDELADLNVTGMAIPDEYGGSECSRVEYSIINEELAYGSLAIATAVSVHCLASAAIAEFGSDAQKERWLPDMSTGRPIGAFALSEPHAGSNPAELSTRAYRDGNEYVISGEKQWITNGARSDVLIVFAVTDPGDPETITQFLVPKTCEGVTVGDKEDKLGLRASDTTPITFDDVRIPVGNQLTPVGDGLPAALQMLTGGRIGIASQAVGVSQAAIDDALSYAMEREQFGRTISEIQMIRHKIADMVTNTRAARYLTRVTAERDDAGMDVRGEASMAKYFASENAVDVTSEAVQIHGGYGYVREFDVERYYRDAKVTTIYEGTSEIQKEIIARTVIDA